MASRRRSRAAAPPRRVAQATAASSPWPHIEALLNDCDGNISIGRIAPIPCAAVATVERNMLAALVRRTDESFLELMQRLDEAIRKAFEEQHFTDEINS